MKNLPIGNQIQTIAGESGYQHLLLGSQERCGISFLSLTCYSNEEFNYELLIVASAEKYSFCSHSNFCTRALQQKRATVTPYRSGRTITLHSGASSISVHEYIVITTFLFRPGTRRNFGRPGTGFKLVLQYSLFYAQNCF
jgi:hypothetical protein